MRTTTDRPLRPRARSPEAPPPVNDGSPKAVQQRGVASATTLPDLPPSHVRPAEEERARNVQVKPVDRATSRWRPYPMGPESAAHLAAERAEGTGVPPLFGVPGGVPIRNMTSILDDTWRALGSKTRPAMVYVMAKGVDGFGHAAIAYKRPNGELTTMNVVGKLGQQICNFMPLEEYLFGVSELTRFDARGVEIKRPVKQGGPWRNPEGGAYHRDLEMFVVWDWPQEKLDAMHAYFEKVNERQSVRGPQGARFRLVAGDWRDHIDRLLGRDHRESGNCAVWTSRGLKEAGAVQEFSLWPKQVALRIITGIGRADPDNFDIVSVPWIEHARRTHRVDARLIAKLPHVEKKLDHYAPNTTIMISATQPFPMGAYRDLATRAGARIVVDPGSTVARVERQSRALSRL